MSEHADYAALQDFLKDACEPEEVVDLLNLSVSDIIEAFPDKVYHYYKTQTGDTERF